MAGGIIAVCLLVVIFGACIAANTIRKRQLLDQLLSDRANGFDLSSADVPRVFHSQEKCP